MIGLCFPPFQSEGRGLRRRVSGGFSRPLPENVESLSTKPSVNSSNHPSMSRNRPLHAVCRTRSREAELRLFQLNRLLIHKKTSSLATPGATVGTKLSAFHEIFLPFTISLVSGLLFIRTEFAESSKRSFG